MVRGETEGSHTQTTLLPAARALALDAFAVEIAEALTSTGVSFVLLKGPTVARWLYQPNEVRSYLDVDLLVKGKDLPRARLALGRKHLQRSYREDALPHGRQPHAEGWIDERSGLSVDLHSTLPGVGVEHDTTWQVLTEGTESIEIGRQMLPQLAERTRALLVALHAAHHGIKDEQALADLSRALSVAREPTWREAAALAERLQATPAFAAGLRLVPSGRALADALGLPAAASIESVLKASSGPELALSLDWLIRTPGLRARAILVGRKFVPPRRVLEARSTLARRGTPGLALAYLLQPVQVIGRATPAIKAWLDARKALRSMREVSSPHPSRRPPRP